MSTSDAGELELRVGGGETPPSTARAARSTTAREQRDETLGERFQQENHHGGEAPLGQQSHPSAIRQEETHKALRLRADRRRKEEAAHCCDSKVQTQKPIGSTFTSCLFLRLSSNPGIGSPELRLKKNSRPCLHSLPVTQRAETEDNSCQVNGQTSPPDTLIRVASDASLSERIQFPAKKKEDVITIVCNEPETTRDLSITQSGEFGPHEPNGPHILSRGSQPRAGTRSIKLEEYIKDQSKSESKETDLVELSNPARTMLSSTVVTVLAPHWSGRPRRAKRFDGTGNSEAQGNLQDHAHERFQETLEGSLSGGSQAQLRVPFLGTRRNTVGWSTKSGPASLDYESKRKMIHTVSLDVNTGRMVNRNIGAGALSPEATTASPVSPFSLEPNEQRRNPQTGHQGGLPSLSSKPTTSSLLLSLRRFNSNSTNSNTDSTVSEINPSSLNSSPSDRDGKIFTTNLSPTFNNNNEQERLKPLLSPTFISYRTNETGPVISPSYSNHRERNMFETRLCSASPTNKDADNTPFTQQSQKINRTYSNLPSSKRVFLSGEQSERQQISRSSDNSTNQFSSPRQSPYDHSAVPKPQSIPRRTILTSTSWWKQVTQEGGSPLKLNDLTNIKNNPNTTLVSPCNDNSDLVSPSPTDNNKRFGGQIPKNTDNNNTAEPVHKGNMNHLLNTQGGTHNLQQRNAEDSLDRESDRFVKQQYGSNLNNREPQKPHSLPSVKSISKIRIATVQTTLIHPKDLIQHDVSNSSFTANATELSPPLLNLKSSNTPTESSSKYNINSTPAFSHNRDSQKFTKPSPSLATTNTLHNQTITSKTASGFPVTQNTKTFSTLPSYPVASQSSMLHASPSTVSSSQTTKFATTTPTPKSLHPKAVSSQIPTVSGFSKANYSSVSTAPTTSSSNTGSHPAAITAPSSSLLSPLVTPALASSPSITISSLLTPPATPIITSPNYSDTSSPKEGKTFSSSQESDSKPREGKRVRRVTWEDSVDLQCCESITVKKPESSQVPTNSLSPSISPRSIKAPSIFNFLRSSNQTSNTTLFPPTAKTSSIQTAKGGKYRSLSSDSADLASRERERSKQRVSDTITSDDGKRDSSTPRQERTLSVESGTVQCHSSAPLSLPPDFSGGYKLRYSSPPYSTLMSSRSTQAETKMITPRSPLFKQHSQSNYTPHLPICTDPVAAVTIPTSKPPLSPVRQAQPLCLPFQSKTASSKHGVSDAEVNNNHCKYNSEDRQNGKILLVDNRIHISSQSLQGDEPHDPSSTCVTETLVYSVKSKGDTARTAPKISTSQPLQHTANKSVSVGAKLGRQSHMVQSKEAISQPHSISDQSSSGSSSTESQLPDDESSSRRMKESVLGKSRFFSVESNSEQSPKRNRFALKKSVSTPNSSLSRSESGRANKTNNKMDQVLNRLKQTFSTRRSDDDAAFPWKWKKASQTPSVSGSSDISNASTKMLEEQEQDKGVVLKDSEKGTESTDRWIQNRYTLISPSASGGTMPTDKFYTWSDKSTLETDQDKNASAKHISENTNHPHLMIHSPSMHQFDFYKDNRTDYTPTNQFHSCRDHSPGKSPSPSTAYSTQFRKSTSSPRSPFSPFSSLSPLSPFSSPDVTDDSVFYSPKLQRRRESPSPCEPVEGISLGSSRRSRASTGPPSVGPAEDKECLASSYADLKYGIEPGRSFSVSSVMSSRPSGPGRISTGSRFMSVGNLSESVLSCEGTGKDLDEWSVTPNWTTEYDSHSSKDSRMSYFPSDPGKMRSRSLPRSLTRRLANWSSGGSPSVTTPPSKPTRVWSPNMNTCHFAWDTEGPPTPPPTPPLSPVSRRMSKPPSLSSPTFPSSPGAPQQVDSQSPKGHLPSRGYVSSLSTFEESSDSSSDTTTDDEYYLETGEDDEKETEL